MKKNDFQILMNLIVDIDSQLTQSQILEKIIPIYKNEIGCDFVCFIDKSSHLKKGFLNSNSLNSKFQNPIFFDKLNQDSYSKEEFILEHLNGYNYYAFQLIEFGWLVLITQHQLSEILLVNIKKPILYLTNKLELACKIKSRNHFEERLNIQTELADKILSGVIIVDLDGCLLYLNTIAKKWTGIKDENLNNYKIFDIEEKLNEHSMQKWLEHVKELKEVESLKGEGQIRNVENNKITFADVSLKYFSVNNREFIIANLIDITENLDSKKKINEEIELQDLLLKIAGEYLNINYARIAETVQQSLSEIGSYVNADRVYIFDYDFKNETCSNTFEWCTEGVSPEINNLQDIPIKFFPEWIEKHKKNEPFIVDNVNNLPDSGENGLKAILSSQNIKSLITLPMFEGDHLMGFVGFDSVFHFKKYSERQIKLLKLFSHMLVNIELRTQWEDNFRTQRERYISIINDVNLGLMEVDKDLKIKFINNNLCKLLGYEEKELLNLNCLETFLDLDSQSRIYKKLPSIKNGENISLEIYPYNKDKIKKPFLMNMCRLIDKSGSIRGYLGTFIDLGRQKAIEQNLKTSKEKAEQASKAKESFLANISHEMRTPLHILNGTLSEVMRTNLDDNQSFLLERGNLASAHLLNLVNNVLDIAKIKSHEIHLDYNGDVLYNSVTEVFKMFRHLAEDKKIDLKFHHNLNSNTIYLFDKQKLKQVLINLISNSIKFTISGSVEFIIDVIEDFVSYSAIRFRVRDTGIGMSEEFKKGLFKNFKRENDFVSISNEGTGLGMPISRRLVKLMGGDIKVKSEKNVGSEFSFELELKKVCLINKNIKVKKDFKTIIGKKILVVEDNLMSQILIKKKLERLGADVTTCNDGLEAIEVLKKRNFDILLIDMQMPNLDGLETVKIIRKNLELKVPIIIITANVFSNDIKKFKIYDIDDYVLKPFKDKNIFNTISEVLQIRSSV